MKNQSAQTNRETLCLCTRYASAHCDWHCHDWMTPLLVRLLVMPLGGLWIRSDHFHIPCLARGLQRLGQGGDRTTNLNFCRFVFWIYDWKHLSAAKKLNVDRWQQSLWETKTKSLKRLKPQQSFNISLVLFLRSATLNTGHLSHCL